MTWAYLLTEGTTKHPNEHKHTHAYSAGLCAYCMSISQNWSFYCECNSQKPLSPFDNHTGCGCHEAA